MAVYICVRYDVLGNGILGMRPHVETNASPAMIVSTSFGMRQQDERSMVSAGCGALMQWQARYGSAHTHRAAVTAAVSCS
jgi:hypothetical protein